MRIEHQRVPHTQMQGGLDVTQLHVLKIQPCFYVRNTTPLFSQRVTEVLI